MIILGIETSCDETGVGIVEKQDDDLILRANVVASSLAIHSKSGGIIPEIAAREQMKYMIPVLQQALQHGLGYDISNPPIDAIAVTYGPGLIGSLLIGVETAKTLAFAWKKPVIPINHMVGHIYANWLSNTNDKHPLPHRFPALILVVSGGHTDLLLMEDHGDIRVIGGTRDDAAGEALDKIARLLTLPYPGGPAIEKRAEKGNPDFIHLPRPLIGDKSYDLSFSGLKTAVLRETLKEQHKSEQWIADMAASTQKAIIDVLTKKTVRAAKEYQVKSILLSGGVAANNLLRKTLIEETKFQDLSVNIIAPKKSLCTDNGAMIAAAAACNYHPIDWEKLTVNPDLYY